jgi:hypothetical protein
MSRQKRVKAHSPKHFLPRMKMQILRSCQPTRLPGFLCLSACLSASLFVFLVVEWGANQC